MVWSEENNMRKCAPCFSLTFTQVSEKETKGSQWKPFRQTQGRCWNEMWENKKRLGLELCPLFWYNRQRSDLKVCRFCHCVQFLLRRTMHSSLSSSNCLLLPYSLPALLLCCLCSTMNRDKTSEYRYYHISTLFWCHISKGPPGGADHKGLEGK